MMKKVFPGKRLVFLFFTLLSVACSSPAVQQHTVDIAQMKFVPEQLTVHKGDRITFINNDIVMHNIVDSSGELLIDSLPAGVSKTITISESFNYYCSLHPVMKGRIVVD
jgi:plastocyanin